jgi:ubiquinol-cytochrome c reductase iron-sulfur subunit
MSEDSMSKEPVKAHSGVANPYSLPQAPGEHQPRQTDINPKAEQRAVRQVALAFGLSIVMVVLFFIAFIAIPVEETIKLPWIGEIGALHVALGVTFGLAIFLIGVGAVHWAKKLMSDVEVVQERHEYKSTPEDTEGALKVFEEGAEASGFKKYPILRRCWRTVGVDAVNDVGARYPNRFRHHLPAGQGRRNPCRGFGECSPRKLA